ncbi:MAG: NAD(P)H-hydrate dehydratase [Planctomycetes bacterium]|nr:NAD(P)H-hydrate dehydratase [Planctomycetota bacterium]
MTLPTLPLAQLPARRPESHKGDFGRALLVGGSRGMSGAIALAGIAALRGGAGLVKLAVPDVCLDVVASFEPSYMTAPLPSDNAGRIALSAKEVIAQLSDEATCLACGPGLGRSDELTELVGGLYETATQPIVFDADALNALSSRDRGLLSADGPRILTPHPGEFRRLIGDEDSEFSIESLRDRSIRMAAEHGVVMVLKDHRTLITDGNRVTYNKTGNPGMATGGSGDVLTGLITALVCQGLPPFEAAQLGVHLHGLAGDLAAERLGQTSMIAKDLADHLPEAFYRLDA